MSYMDSYVVDLSQRVGVIERGESGWTRQVIARSGSALLHFFSDDAYAMEGFNVTYAAYSCPSDDHRTNCSSHGECDEGTCRCEPGWTGVACDQPLCPDDCNSAYGGGTCTSTGCVCNPSRTGEDCARDASAAGWLWRWREPGEGGEGGAPPAAGHALLARGGELIRVGGESFAPADFMYRYKVADNIWEPMANHGDAPAARFAHSAVLHEDEIIVYGGVVASDEPERGGGLAGLEGRAGEVTNEIWRLNLAAQHPQWINATPSGCGNKPAPLKHCGLMADGVKRFSNSVRGLGDELSVGLQQDGATTWLRSRDRGGCEKHKTGLSGEAYVQQWTSFG
ncbi:hypothetical protein MSG28_014106 [Choristoneura fumiferana]|uniref:Uncharacterized protein n=1 Tax=Choristoneura fumiferana TaxID=7141 RepID=A0ACC0JFY2_CHOFU|nr:hypothetical protein MSG28_014106 [Choristoneura fumiferana]